MAVVLTVVAHGEWAWLCVDSNRGISMMKSNELPSQWSLFVRLESSHCWLTDQVASFQLEDADEDEVQCRKKVLSCELLGPFIVFLPPLPAANGGFVFVKRRFS